MKRTIQFNLILIFICTGAVIGFAQAGSSKTIPASSKAAPIPAKKSIRNAHIYITPMDSGLNDYLIAEITKQKLPLVIVTDDSQAEYIITGSSSKGGKWYNNTMRQDRNKGTIQIVNVSDKSVLWASQAGDRSVFWGTFARGGQAVVAERLVKQMKKDLLKK